MACPYKDLLGIPKEGVHARRIGPFALNDLIGTLLGSYLISSFFETDFWITLFMIFVWGELLHYIFCVQTEFLTMIGITV